MVLSAASTGSTARRPEALDVSAAVAGSAAAINTGAGAPWIQILNFGPCRSQAVLLLSERRRGRLVSSNKPAAGFLPVGCSGGLERAT